MKWIKAECFRWLLVFIFAVAMAWVEAAVVFYLRTMIDRVEPHQPNPFPVIGGFAPTESVREAATLVMLLMVGLLAGRTQRSRLGYAAVAFGIWDIFYYVFLKKMCDWPHSLFDWDVLFLLPLPWWGPVLAPVAISTLLIIWGTLASQFENQYSTGSSRGVWLLSFAGAALALYLFMADTLRVAAQGVDAIRNVLPAEFHWLWFAVALGLMTAPVVQTCRRFWLPRPVPNTRIEATEEFE